MGHRSVTCDPCAEVLNTGTIRLKGQRLRPDHRDLADGVKLATIAVIAAVFVATAVIALGQVVLPERHADAADREDVVLVGLR